MTIDPEMAEIINVFFQELAAPPGSPAAIGHAA